jgi:hypothetical protein
MIISDGWWASSLTVAAEDRQQRVQPGLHPPEIADVAPVDGIGVVTEVVVGELLQPFQPGVDRGSAGELGVEGGLLGAHRGLRDVIDDATMNALFNQEAKLFVRIAYQLVGYYNENHSNTKGAMPCRRHLPARVRSPSPSRFAMR